MAWLFRKPNILLCLLCLLGAISACKPSVPSEFIQPDELEDILYEYHLAEGITMLKSDSVAFYHYKNAILNKYGYSSKQFDTSLEYYLRHADKLKSIYTNIAERIDKDIKANGGTLGEFASASLNSAQGDTVNVWKGENAFVLSTKKSFNVYSFELKTDSSYHAGDKLTFGFNTSFVSKNGMKEGTVIFAMQLKNDSIVSQMMRITGGESVSITIEDAQRQGIKSVKGSILWTGGTEYHATKNDILQLMAVLNPFLIRIHLPKNSVSLQTNSLATDSIKATETSGVSTQEAPKNDEAEW